MRLTRPGPRPSRPSVGSARANIAGSTVARREKVMPVGRIQRSWYLGKLSWRVLRSDRTLAVFPVLTAVGALVVLAFFGGLIALAGIDSSGSNDALAPLGWV